LFSDSGTGFNFNDEISFLREENVNPQKLWKLIWTRIMNKITMGLIKKWIREGRMKLIYNILPKLVD
jgi:hypothetical protein